MKSHKVFSCQKKGWIITCLLLTSSINLSAGIKQINRSRQPEINYFGQTPPESNPLPFGRVILNNNEIRPHSAPIFSSNGKEVYFSVFYPQDIKRLKDILFMKFENGIWNKPQSDYFDLNEKILNNTGYKFLHHNNYKLALVVFQLNAALFPDSFNVYDSLGEAFMLLVDNSGALKNYEKNI